MSIAGLSRTGHGGHPEPTVERTADTAAFPGIHFGRSNEVPQRVWRALVVTVGTQRTCSACIGHSQLPIHDGYDYNALLMIWPQGCGGSNLFDIGSQLLQNAKCSVVLSLRRRF